MLIDGKTSVEKERKEEEEKEYCASSGGRSGREREKRWQEVKK